MRSRRFNAKESKILIEIDMLSAEDLDEYLRRLSLLIDEGDLLIMQGRLGLIGPTRTLEDLAIEFGYTRERIRQRWGVLLNKLLTRLSVPNIFRYDL